MKPLFSSNTLLEGHLIWNLLERFLEDLHPTIRNEARLTALKGYAKAVSTIARTIKPGTGALTHLGQVAETVVSKGGLNDAARAYLRASHFSDLVRSHSSPTTAHQVSIPETPGIEKKNDFEPASYYPCILGSGRLAAAFLTGFQRLGVPNRNITLFSRSPLTTSSPLMKWAVILGEGDPIPEQCLDPSFKGTLDHPPNAFFLLLKRRAFEDPTFRERFLAFRKRNGNSIVVNLMAGGRLDLKDPGELVVRANVLISQPDGGNLLCHGPQWENENFGHVFSALSEMGQLLPFSNMELLGKLTFFTSTLPIVFTNQFDSALYKHLDNKEADPLLTATWNERSRFADAMACPLRQKELVNIIRKTQVHTQLQQITEKYMQIYLGLA